jgi:hypothetical protein
MGLIVTLIIWVVLAAVIVWIADWKQRSTFLIGAFAARLTRPSTTISARLSPGEAWLAPTARADQRIGSRSKTRTPQR